MITLYSFYIGQTFQKLKKLDFNCKSPYISESNYNFLKK